MILAPRIIGKVHGGIVASMFTQVNLSTLMNGLYSTMGGLVV